MHEKLVRRTIYIAQCSCGCRTERESNPPRETRCPSCKKWVEFKEETWVGKDIETRSQK